MSWLPDRPSSIPNTNSLTPPRPVETSLVPLASSQTSPPPSPSRNSPTPTSTPSTSSSSSRESILSRADSPRVPTSRVAALEDSPNYPYRRSSSQEDESSSNQSPRQAARKQREPVGSDSSASILEEFESILNTTPPNNATSVSNPSEGRSYVTKQLNGSVRSVTATHGGSDPSPESSPDEEDAEQVVEGSEAINNGLDQGLRNLQRGQEEGMRSSERHVIDLEEATDSDQT
ncbi:hypothetical protein JCM5350_008336 [Sporobolomyces pararoseus]